ncbi:hypothetical protein LCGC14_2088780 [marine sediment metagenome]|uniref:Uncharacterized protein n=1 Tax=marine sediment metagenome TaxID=412755 RepID=A0A0F9ED89_9ZZZZ
MRTFPNFFGKPEEVSEDLRKIVTLAPVVIGAHLIDEPTGIRQTHLGTAEIRQRLPACLARNAHEPRRYIVCWHNSHGYTDISFHPRMGGEHGALHALRCMYERYSEYKP